MTTRATKQAKKRGWMRVLVPTLVLGVVGACGSRIGRSVDMPLGVTFTLPVVANDLIKKSQQTYPNAALSITVANKVLGLDHEFELIMARDQAGLDVVSRYTSSELRSSAKDTRCPAGLQATVAPNTALLCNHTLVSSGAGHFLLKQSDGTTLSGTTLLTESLDPDTGVKTLSVQF